MTASRTRSRFRIREDSSLIMLGESFESEADAVKWLDDFGRKCLGERTFTIVNETLTRTDGRTFRFHEGRPMVAR